MEISDERSGILDHVNRLNSKSQRLGADMRNEIAGLKKEVIDAMQRLRADLESDQPRNFSIIGASKSSNKTSAVDMDAFTEALSQMEKDGTKIITSLALLESLTFDRMDYRHSKIHDAHPSTFIWMFSNKFKQWLQSPEPIFWLSGKPGSGKSTLMKYLVDNPETPTMLRQWSGQNVQVIASYFFWINGTAMQRSQEGLLQSLLYELLRKCPELIEPTLPDAFKATILMNSDHKQPNHTWNRSDLLDAFKRLTQLELSGTKFCLFLDGLDEYEGDHDELIDLIRDLTKLEIKLCVASRPWNVFEDAFGNNQECKLYLQDLNKADIERYVNDKLRSRREFQRIQVNNHIEANEVVQEIIERSQGVFLWVVLVVRSLTEGLRNHDRLSQLHQRLRAFPSDLNEFFSHILKSMDSTYRVQAAHMCQVTLSAHEPLTPLAFWYLDEEEDNPDMALTMPIQPMTAQVLDYRMEEMKIRINGRCKGLLEVTTTEHDGNVTSHVDFLHRTVKDFLKTTEMQLVFAEWQHQGFNPDLAICKASLAVLKSVALTPPYPAIPSIFAPLGSFFNSARLFEKTGQMVPMDYFGELEKTITQHTALQPGEPKNYPWDYFGVRSLLELAVASGLRLFICARFNDPFHPVSNAERIKLLEYRGINLVRRTRDELNMFILILSLGPPVALNEKLQSVISGYIEHLGHDAMLDAMKEIAKYSEFSMKQGNLLSQRLSLVLSTELSSAEITDLLKALEKCSPPTWTATPTWTDTPTKRVRSKRLSLQSILRRWGV